MKQATAQELDGLIAQRQALVTRLQEKAVQVADSDDPKWNDPDDPELKNDAWWQHPLRCVSAIKKAKTSIHRLELLRAA